MSTIFSERLFASFEEDFRPHLLTLGLSPAMFSNPETEIPIEKYVRLLECVAHHSNPGIGMDMGRNIEAADLGVLGHALFATNNIRHLLETLSRYLYVFAQDNAIRLDIGADTAVISYRFIFPRNIPHEQDVELAVTAINYTIRRATGVDIMPKYVELERREPPHALQIREVQGCPVHYDGGANRLHYQKKVLTMPVRSADPRLFEALEFYLADRLKLRAQDDDLLAKINHLIATSLHAGVPELEAIAKKLGIGRRTLQRRLTEQGVVYHELVDSVRKDIALEYVRQTDYRLTDIALMLGYNESSSFSRAFRRWTGTSANKIRTAG